MSRETKDTLNSEKLVSSQMDSGFLSGSNLVPTSSLCECDEMDLSKRQEIFPVADDRDIKHEEYLPNLDSGIDLSERISSLNLSPLSSQQNIGESLENPSTSIIPETANNVLNEPQKPVPQSKLSQLGLSPYHIEILKEIFKKDEDKDTQLHIAIIRGFIEVVWHITRLLPHQALLDIPNKSGKTPLHLAVAGGDACLARHLIVCGASPVAKNHRGDTPLHIACRSGDLAMVSSLTSQVTVFEVMAARLCYPPNHIPGLLSADLANYDGKTCIHICAQYGHKEALQHLCWYGADINAKESKCGRTALHMAVELRDLELVRFLVESCRASLNIQNYYGLSPYQLAFVNDAQEIFNVLKELGATSDMEEENDLELDNDTSNLDDDDEEFGWNGADLRIGGVSQGCPISVPSAVPISSPGTFNIDKFL